ncbi:MAG: DUF4838 domain-containing protein [Eubacteriales bacterium]|nr:DUF4838 domain-containing protein [Eubacteriales bacterium]
MKKYKSLIAMTALTMAISTAVGCGGSSSSQKTTAKPKGDPVEAAEEHLVSDVNRLHDVSVDWNNPVGDFVVNGKTNYSIVTTGNYAKAAGSLVKYINEATGANLQIDGSGTCNPDNGKYIVFGLNEILESKGVEVPALSTLGSAGYRIKTVGDDVYVGFYTPSAAQTAALAILREVFGFDLFADDMYIFEKDGKVLPQMDITERPDYEYRMPGNQTISEDEKFGMAYTMTDPKFSMSKGGSVHNFYYYLAGENALKNADWYSEMFEKHPKWFSSDKAVVKDERGIEEVIGQPCFTAHGDKEEYAAMVDNLATTFIAKLAENDLTSIISISPNDVTGNNTTGKCTCAACRESFEYYGGSMSGAMVALSNDVAAEMDRRYAESGTERVYSIVVLSYGQGINSPSKKDGSKFVYDENVVGVPVQRCDFDEEGKAILAVDEENNPVMLVCGEHVAYEFAPSSANWLHSFYEPENEMYAASVKAWAGLKGDLYLWGYQMNFHNYLYPYNNYSKLVEQLRFFKEINGNYMFMNGTWENKNIPAFNKLRDYIIGKALFDVNVNYQELKNKFFKYYFGEAEPYMTKYFDLITYNMQVNESFVTGNIQAETISDDSLWPIDAIRYYLDIFAQAYAEIEPLKETNKDRYDALYEHLLIEELFPRFVLCQHYPASFTSAEELKAARQAFADDFKNLGNTTEQEHFKITDAGRPFYEWGVE